jgi:hypothetical protein
MPRVQGRDSGGNGVLSVGVELPTMPICSVRLAVSGDRDEDGGGHAEQNEHGCDPEGAPAQALAHLATGHQALPMTRIGYTRAALDNRQRQRSIPAGPGTPPAPTP